MLSKSGNKDGTNQHEFIVQIVQYVIFDGGSGKDNTYRKFVEHEKGNSVKKLQKKLF